MPPAPLPAIPILYVAASSEPAIASIQAEPAYLALLLANARRSYTPLGLRFADHRTSQWSQRSRSPYAAQVDAVAQAIGRPGAYLLNYSYEWGCTTGAADDPRNGGTTLLRTRDWPFDGLGRAVMAVRHQGPAGGYVSVTWPGYVGVLTGSAPGRFAAAINQPPLPLPGWGRAAGWIAARLRVNRSTALPPSHLLRLAFDTCHSFAEAAALLRETPICMPVIFTLAGAEPGQALVIERNQTAGYEPAEAAAANHWAAEPGWAGRPRNASSHQRRIAMTTTLAAQPGWSFDWLQAPILRPDTRLAVMANPRTGRMLIQGWEKTGPATAVLDLPAC